MTEVIPPRIPSDVNPLGPEHREKLNKAKHAVAKARPLLEALAYCGVDCDDQQATLDGLCTMCERVEEVFFPGAATRAVSE